MDTLFLNISSKSSTILWCMQNSPDVILIIKDLSRFLPDSSRRPNHVRNSRSRTTTTSTTPTRGAGMSNRRRASPLTGVAVATPASLSSTAAAPSATGPTASCRRRGRLCRRCRPTPHPAASTASIEFHAILTSRYVRRSGRFADEDLLSAGIVWSLLDIISWSLCQISF